MSFAPLHGLAEAWWEAMPGVSLAVLLWGLPAFLLDSFVLGRSRNARSWLWRVVFAKWALLLVAPAPFLLVLPGALDLEFGPGPGPGSAPILDRSGSPTLPRPPWPVFMPSPDAPPPPGSRMSAEAPDSPAPLRTLLFILWSCAAGAFLLREYLGWQSLRSIRRHARPADPSTIEPDGDGTPHPGIGTIRILVTNDPGVSGPLVTGLWNPSVLVPESLWSGMTTTERRAVLAHELAHVRRRDLVWNLLRRLVRGALMFHPLVAWAERRAWIADEIACDATALDRGGMSPSAYGSLVLRVAEQAPLRANHEGPAWALAAGLGPTGRSLAERFRALGSPGRGLRRHEVLLWGATGLAVLVAGLVAWKRPGIRQFDDTWRVRGFHVSHGAAHGITVEREACQWRGWTLARSTRQSDPTTPDPRVPGTGWPRRLSGWLNRVGFATDVASSSYSAHASDGESGCRIVVRFESESPEPSLGTLRGELIDPHGERIPLPAVPVPCSSRGEFVRAWTLAPAPLTAEHFHLSLSRADSGREVARLDLGRIGGTPNPLPSP